MKLPLVFLVVDCSTRQIQATLLRDYRPWHRRARQLQWNATMAIDRTTPTPSPSSEETFTLDEALYDGLGPVCAADGGALLHSMDATLPPDLFPVTFQPTCQCLETNVTQSRSSDPNEPWELERRTFFDYDCINGCVSCFASPVYDSYCGVVQIRERFWNEPASFFSDYIPGHNATVATTPNADLATTLDTINSGSSYLFELCITYETDERVCFGETTDDFDVATMETPCFISYNHERCQSCRYNDSAVHPNGWSSCYHADCSNIETLPLASRTIDNCAGLGFNTTPWQWLLTWDDTVIAATVDDNCSNHKNATHGANGTDRTTKPWSETSAVVGRGSVASLTGAALITWLWSVFYVLLTG